jgi:hypothetical protein
MTSLVSDKPHQSLCLGEQSASPGLLRGERLTLSGRSKGGYPVVVVRSLLVCLAAGAVAALAPLLGCGREVGAPDSLLTASQGTRAGSLDLPPLPEWAPENPSPEFMRAARVFKTWVNEPAITDELALAERALEIRFRRTLVPAWEFFGSLTDEQIERFRSTRDLRIRVKDLTDKQRAALYRFFDVWRKEFKGVSSANTGFSEDWLVDLYKLGASEDLSNVEVQFLVRGSGRLAMLLRSRQPDGSLGPPFPIGLGDM